MAFRKPIESAHALPSKELVHRGGVGCARDGAMRSRIEGGRYLPLVSASFFLLDDKCRHKLTG